MALAFFFLPHRQLPCFQGRSCSAGIWSPHWCGCAQWLTSSPTRPKGGRGVTWLPTARVRDLIYRLLDMFGWCLRLTISSWKNVDVIGRSFRSSNVMFIVVFELFQLPFLTCAIGHLFGVKATCLRSNEAFGLVYAGKSTRVKVWRKQGGWILTGFCMTFWYSNAIQTTYYCIYLEGMTVACIQSATPLFTKNGICIYLHSASMHADLLGIACHRQASSTWGEL